MKFTRIPAVAALAALSALAPLPAHAHGFAGDRFFPATLLTDDPFVADEMSAPTLTLDPKAIDGSETFGLDFNLSKRLTPDIGIQLSQGWQHLKAPGMPGVMGLTGFSSELDWQFFTNGPHEATAMVGLHSSWAHTGRVQALGATSIERLEVLVERS